MEDNLLNISVYIINYSNEIHSPINNLKLQKILYCLQAISLVELNQKCFESKIMKWHTGPGIPFVYQYFRTNEQESLVFQIPRGIVHNLSLMMRLYFFYKKK